MKPRSNAEMWLPAAITLLGLLPGGSSLHGAEGTSPAQGSEYLKVVRQYADTMIDVARDTYGPEKSGLILSAFDRMAMKPLTTRAAAPAGVRRGDRSGIGWVSLTGVNPQLDQNLLRIFYALTEVTGDSRYAKAADEELKWFLENTQSPVTGLLPWGEHLSWEVMSDKVISGGEDPVHEFARPWMLWDRCYELAPEPCKRFALGLWEHQIANHKTGGFDRHAPYFEHGPRDGKDFARHAGFYIRTWCYGYKYTKDDTFLKAIEVLLARFEKKRTQADGTMAATIGPMDPGTAATMVPDPLAKRLRDFAAEEDELILASLREADGKLKPIKATWQAGYSSGTPASGAMYYLGRYEQVPNPGYKEIILATADAYLGSFPTEDVDLWPMTMGHTISLEVAAYRWTKKEAYRRQADRLARMAVERFWQDKPIPKASARTGHYESITGPDSLALSLLELHAATHDVTVPIPSNTIDR
jgi:hypothetical protein